jgi:RimJ/RimL family protein N-acetyltransferase
MEKSIALACEKSSQLLTLKPVDSPERLRLVAGWLNAPDNAKWLDFGDGRQQVTPEWLKIATQRGALVLRLFEGEEGVPIGVVGLGSINPHFKSATMWVVLGEKRSVRNGFATRATRSILTLGFEELGLHSINTWIVDTNPSIGVAMKVGFRPAGRQRQCHFIDGRPYDRLWFDLLASEHTEQRHALQP